MTLEERFVLFQGRVTYRELCARGSFDWLDRPIIATEQSRIRLRRWAESGMPAGDPEKLVFLPDEDARELSGAVHDVVEWLPPPIRSYLVSHVAVLAIGERCGGWCASVPHLLGARLLFLKAPATERLILHEFAHAWIHGTDEPGESPTLADHRRAQKITANTLALAYEWDLEERLAEIRHRQAGIQSHIETQADALVQFLLDWRNRRRGPVKLKEGAHRAAR